jgi:hypothetical protein
VYFVQFRWVFNQSCTVTRKLSVSFVRFRAPLQQADTLSSTCYGYGQMASAGKGLTRSAINRTYDRNMAA